MQSPEFQVAGEMQVGTTATFCFTRMASVKETKDHKGCWGCGEGGPQALCLGRQTVAVTMETGVALQQELEVDLPSDPATALLVCTSIFFYVLLRRHMLIHVHAVLSHQLGQANRLDVYLLMGGYEECGVYTQRNYETCR